MTGAAQAIEVTVRRADVLHFLEYPEGREPPPRIARVVDEVLAEARTLVEARGAWVTLPVAAAERVGLAPIDAAGLVVGLVTAGPALEARSRELSRAGELTRAVIMDAAGSAAAEEAADVIGAQIVGEDAGGDAAPVSCRLSPGYGRWALTSQTALFEVLPHEAVGVSLTASLMMVPEKSISFAMWLGADGRPAAGLSGCLRCALERCRYRRAPREAPSP